MCLFDSIIFHNLFLLIVLQTPKLIFYELLRNLNMYDLNDNNMIIRTITIRHQKHKWMFPPIMLDLYKLHPKHFFTKADRALKKMTFNMYICLCYKDFRLCFIIDRIIEF